MKLVNWFKYKRTISRWLYRIVHQKKKKYFNLNRINSPQYLPFWLFFMSLRRMRKLKTQYKNRRMRTIRRHNRHLDSFAFWYYYQVYRRSSGFSASVLLSKLIQKKKKKNFWWNKNFIDFRIKNWFSKLDGWSRQGYIHVLVARSKIFKSYMSYRNSKIRLKRFTQSNVLKKNFFIFNSYVNLSFKKVFYLRNYWFLLRVKRNEKKNI